MSTDKVCPNCNGRPDLYMDVMSGNGPGSGTCTCGGTGKVPVRDIDVPDIPDNHEAEELDAVELFQKELMESIDPDSVLGILRPVIEDTGDKGYKALQGIQSLLTQQRTAAEQAGYERGRVEQQRIAYELADLGFKDKDGTDIAAAEFAELQRLNAALQPPQSGEKL